MLAFCDSSALIKAYVHEPHTEAVLALLGTSEPIAASRITWAECHAAFARRLRHQTVAQAALTAARMALARTWRQLLIIEVSQDVVERAGEHADTFALRAYDAVQLASAHELALAAGEPVSFACFDTRLNKAARVLGLEVPFAAAL